MLIKQKQKRNSTQTTEVLVTNDYCEKERCWNNKPMRVRFFKKFILKLNSKSYCLCHSSTGLRKGERGLCFTL